MSNVAEFNFVVQFLKRDNGYDNRVAEFDSPSQNRENPPLWFIVLLSRVWFEVACAIRVPR